MSDKRACVHMHFGYCDYYEFAGPQPGMSIWYYIGYYSADEGEYQRGGMYSGEHPLSIVNQAERAYNLYGGAEHAQ